MAIRQPEAEAMRQTLKDKGFPAVLSPGPNNLTRVLVGPYSDTQSFGRAKTDIENAGFHEPLPQYKRHLPGQGVYPRRLVVLEVVERCVRSRQPN
jgi:hypothetical protein